MSLSQPIFLSGLYINIGRFWSSVVTESSTLYRIRAIQSGRHVLASHLRMAGMTVWSHKKIHWDQLQVCEGSGIFFPQSRHLVGLYLKQIINLWLCLPVSPLALLKVEAAAPSSSGLENHSAGQNRTNRWVNVTVHHQASAKALRKCLLSCRTFS